MAVGVRPGGDIIDEADEAAGDGEVANAVTAGTAEPEVALPFNPELGEELLGLATMVLNAVLMGVDEPIEGGAEAGRVEAAAVGNGGTAGAGPAAVTAAVVPTLAATAADEGGTDVVEAGTLFTTLLLLLLRTLLEFEMALDC